MTPILSIVRERFPRLTDALINQVPAAVLGDLETREVDDVEAALAREMMAAIPVDRTEAITDAALKFTGAVIDAFLRFVADVGTEECYAAYEYVMAMASKGKE